MDFSALLTFANQNTVNGIKPQKGISLAVKPAVKERTKVNAQSVKAVLAKQNAAKLEKAKEEAARKQKVLAYQAQLKEKNRKKGKLEKAADKTFSEFKNTPSSKEVASIKKPVLHNGMNSVGKPVHTKKPARPAPPAFENLLKMAGDISSGKVEAQPLRSIKTPPEKQPSKSSEDIMRQFYNSKQKSKSTKNQPKSEKRSLPPPVNVVPSKKIKPSAPAVTDTSKRPAKSKVQESRPSSKSTLSKVPESRPPSKSTLSKVPESRPPSKSTLSKSNRTSQSGAPVRLKKPEPIPTKSVPVQKKPVYQTPVYEYEPPTQQPVKRGIAAQFGTNAIPRSCGYYSDEEEDEYDSEMDDFIDDGEIEGVNDVDVSGTIKSVYGYDKSRYKRESDYELSKMEASYRDIMKEEAKSLRIAQAEDEAEWRREMERKQKKLKLKKK